MLLFPVRLITGSACNICDILCNVQMFVESFLEGQVFEFWTCEPWFKIDDFVVGVGNCTFSRGQAMWIVGILNPSHQSITAPIHGCCGRTTFSSSQLLASEQS